MAGPYSKQRSRQQSEGQTDEKGNSN